MENLAEKTGLSRTTLYRRTGGREALLDELARAGLHVGDRGDARERLLRAARVVFGRAGPLRHGDVVRHPRPAARPAALPRSRGARALADRPLPRWSVPSCMISPSPSPTSHRTTSRAWEARAPTSAPWPAAASRSRPA